MLAPSETDFYSLHLAKVNQTTDVTVSREIKNHQGAQLVPKGAKLTQPKAELIVKHKLAVPLEQCVVVENTLSGAELFTYIRKFVGLYPGLKAATNNSEIIAVLKQQTKAFERYPIIQQKLAVLAHQFPKIHHASVFSAVAGTCIAVEMGLTEGEQQAVFLGGLMHNCGFLHIDPELIEDNLDIEKSGNQAIQVHPKVGKLFLDIVPKLSKKVSRAVADHHERTDGTGYPSSKFGNELSYPSQIIAITDLIVTTHTAYVHHGKHTHQLILVVLQLNDNVHFDEVYRAAAKLFQSVPPAQACTKTPPSPFNLLRQREKVIKRFDAEKKLAFVLMKKTRTVLVRSMAAMVGRLATSLSSSGILQDEYQQWLRELAKQDDQNEHLNLIKSEVMMNEIDDQLLKLKVLIEKAIGTIDETEVDLIESTKASYQQLNDI